MGTIQTSVHVIRLQCDLQAVLWLLEASHMFAKDVRPAPAHNLLFQQLCNVAADAGGPRRLSEGLL